LTGFTALVAIFFGLLALTRRNNGAAVAVLILSMLIWPEYLRFPLGLFNASVPRFVALLLLAKAIGRGRHQNISTCAVDRLVFWLWLWILLATVISSATQDHLIETFGRGLDTILMYFVVRLYIITFDDMKGMVWWLALCAVLMGIIGIVETVTGYSPYAGMTEYRTWKWFDEEPPKYRLGLMRAKGSTSVHIFFGLAMMILTGILWSIVKGTSRNRFISVAILFGFAGAFASMSSGPWLGCAMILLLGLYRHRLNWIKPTLMLIAIMAIGLEVASNRHFYNLIDYLALDAHTAWYRTRLFEVAASQLYEFWLIGVGSNWPHHWGLLLDGRLHIDVVNHFLIIALYGGLPAMFLYILSHWYALKRIVTLFRSTGDTSVSKVAFHLGVVLVALDFSTLSVGLFGPPLPLSNMLLGLIISVTAIEKLTEVSNDSLPATSLEDNKSGRKN
jgi:hypothetical protein